MPVSIFITVSNWLFNSLFPPRCTLLPILGSIRVTRPKIRIPVPDRAPPTSPPNGRESNGISLKRPSQHERNATRRREYRPTNNKKAAPARAAFHMYCNQIKA